MMYELRNKVFFIIIRFKGLNNKHKIFFVLTKYPASNSINNYFAETASNSINKDFAKTAKGKSLEMQTNSIDYVLSKSKRTSDPIKFY